MVRIPPPMLAGFYLCASIVSVEAARADDALATLAGSRWIWFDEDQSGADAAVTTRYLRQRIELPSDAKIDSATWLLTVDDAHIAWVNGVEVGKGDHWPRVRRYDVGRHLRPGVNVLAVAATNGAGPAGFIGKLIVRQSGLAPRDVVTDTSWKGSDREQPGWQTAAFDDSGWRAAREIGPMGVAPWGQVGPIAPPPDHFPRFIVPGHDEQMASIRALFWLHYQPAGPLVPLWDEWMPKATLWPAPADEMRARWAAALAGRGMNEEGYVHTHQHDGPAHAEGWPFPRWQDGGGAGWHFVSTGVPGYEAPLTTPDGWKLTRARGGTVNDKGWQVDLTEPRAIAEAPPFNVEARLAPWLRITWWANGLNRANCYVEWTTKEQPEYSPERRMYFPAADSVGQAQPYLPASPTKAVPLDTSMVETRTMIPLYRSPHWNGTITGLRIHFDNPANSPTRKGGVAPDLQSPHLVIKSIHTAFDTRHNINNLNFIRGVHDYFRWSRDVALLRDQIGRVRKAMRFVMSEFNTRNRKCIYTTWPGHEGRSGVRYLDGQKRVIPGEGIGSNYWDLLPFGGEDALASIYYYDTLLSLADLEAQIANHPEWNLARGADAYDPADLRAHANEVRDYGRKRFWNESTGRFGTVDLTGVMHDYGFTFLNTEAVHFDFATEPQAKSIHAWLAGERMVADDTSTGADIYHWRFGPRSTTKRNLDYYYWGWSHAEHIPFGGQVQDGGGVLGWSYHDLMARLNTAGPDDAWARLREITKWFDETQTAGGYRHYYAADPSRGTMQGANVAGGLGLDKEFFESILVPQVMLYGFLGFQPTAEGFRIDPKLPKDWPSLRVTRIHLHEVVIDVEASETEIVVATVSGEATETIELPTESKRVTFRAGETVRFARK